MRWSIAIAHIAEDRVALFGVEDSAGMNSLTFQRPLVHLVVEGSWQLQRLGVPNVANPLDEIPRHFVNYPHVRADRFRLHEVLVDFRSELVPILPLTEISTSMYSETLID